MGVARQTQHPNNPERQPFKTCLTTDTMEEPKKIKEINK